MEDLKTEFQQAHCSKNIQAKITTEKTASETIAMVGGSSTSKKPKPKYQNKTKIHPNSSPKGGSNNKTRGIKKSVADSWRPMGKQYRKKEIKVCINGCEVLLRHCRSFVMFEIDTFTKLISKSLPLRLKSRELQSIMAVYSKARRPQLTAEARAWRNDFMTWKSMKHFLEHTLHDQCLKDILKTYVPHDGDSKFDGSLGLSKAPNTFLGSDQDFIKIAGVTVPFIVKGSKVYFDLLAAFSLMGQLQLAMKNDWKEIDTLLQEQGFDLRVAFRINISERSYMTWKSQRSAITYDALKALVHSEIVPEGQRKDRLIAILEHLDTDMMGITRAREDLVNKIQAKVDENVMVSDPIAIDLKSKDPEVLTGTEICYRGCGRYYHFSQKCCSQVHHLKWAGTEVSYIVMRQQIFLEKCAVFYILGRMCVVRFGDYRTVDRHLTSAGLEIHKNFMYENSIEKPMEVNPGGRRTHISLEACGTLLKSGFVAKPLIEKLTESYLKILDKQVLYKSKCCKYEGKDRVDLAEATSSIDNVSSTNVENNNEDDEEMEDTSSGIESGQDDSNSSVGERSPETIEINANNDTESNNNFVESILDNRFDLTLSLDPIQNSLYCKASDLAPIVGMDYESLIKILKRKKNYFDIDNPFKPKLLFKNRKFQDDYFSVTCFKLFVERNYLKITENKVKVAEDLNNLLQKYEVKTVGTKGTMDIDVKDTKEESPEEEDEDLEPEKVDNNIQQDQNDGSSLDHQAIVKICDLNIPFNIKGNNVYLYKRAMMELFKIRKGRCANFIKMDSILNEAGITKNEAFILHHGRLRKYISIPAIKILMGKEFLVCKNPALKPDIEQALAKLTQDKETLIAKKSIKLPSFSQIDYKLAKGTVFLKTLQLLIAVGCPSKYLDENPSRSYFVLIRLLKKRGMNIKECFLKQGVCKYGYISVKAATNLFKMESGPFRNKKKMKLLQKELQSAMKKLPQFPRPNSYSNEDGSGDHHVDIVGDVVSIGNVKVRYLIKNDMIYFHRMTIFESIGLERALILNSKGLPAINRILTSNKIDVSKSYLKSGEEHYSFISLPALWTILDVEDPLVVLLEGKNAFQKDLMQLIYKSIARNFKGHEKFTILGGIPWMMLDEKLHFHKAKTVALSGLYDKANKLQAFHSNYVSLEDVLKLIRLDSDQQKAAAYSKLIWTDMISAVMHETPKLRIHIKLMDFRAKLFEFVQNEVNSFLATPSSITSDILPRPLLIKTDITETETENESELATNDSRNLESSSMTRDNNENTTTETEDTMTSNMEFTTTEESSAETETDENNAGVENLTLEEFEKLHHSVRSIRSGLIGDWHVKRCDAVEIRLIVNPGYGASKKVSFVQPDVSAILKYELSLKSHFPIQLTINDLRVPKRLVEPIFRRELQNGLYSLLYSLLTLRPCFGNFQPELVETFEKRGRLKIEQSETAGSATSMASMIVGSDSNMDNESLVIDTNFIGSSQNSRTYAGTVRSKKCSVLATSKISDTCQYCAGLHGMVINRSVLSSPKKATRSLSQESTSSSASTSSASNNNSGNHPQQQSVWKLESSSVEGCTFVCPQLQSYNTSLPHQFMSTSQASSVVDHRVYIGGQDLNLRVTLNNKAVVGKSFLEFEKTKEVGPLLNKVASMRMCVGYPDEILVTEAKYLMQNKPALPQEIRKFFQYICVDEGFSGKMNSNNVALNGTMRATSCRYVASDHADICDQCRLLQEPLNFLGL